MLNAFKLSEKKLIKINEIGDITCAVWIDLVEPEERDREFVLTHLGQNLATSIELDDIEASARFFEDDEGLHVHSFFFYAGDSEERAGNSTVAFTINNDRLFTLRERDLPAFRLYRMRSRYQNLTEGNAYEILLDLFEVKVEQLADEIENIYSELENSSSIIMDRTSQEHYDEAIASLAELEDTAWKVRLCLMDSQRAINYLIRRAKMTNDQLEQARDVIRDIESLIPHNESLFQKVNFLMQAATSFINIEQSRIIKIFSVVSVVFLPPTVVASAYGMNFKFMPELEWKAGYPLALGLMLVAGLAPYIYFKLKKWL